MDPNRFRLLKARRHHKMMKWCAEQRREYEDVIAEFDKAVEQQEAIGLLNVRLGDIARICVNDPRADFWLQRRGSEERVGRPIDKAEYIKQGQDWGKDWSGSGADKPQRIEEIGICVVKPDVVAVAYLKAFMEMLWLSGYWRNLSYGMLQLKHIRTRDVKDVNVTFNA